MDRLQPETRSRLMSRIGGRHTAPEMAVRKILAAIGVRYRLHAKELPGRPDIVNRKRGFAIFVHGCFWHSHSCKRGAKPASNREFWDKKLTQNKQRDRIAAAALRKKGWHVLTIWECQIKDAERLAAKIGKWLRDINGKF